VFELGAALLVAKLYSFTRPRTGKLCVRSGRVSLLLKDVNLRNRYWKKESLLENLIVTRRSFGSLFETLCTMLQSEPGRNDLPNPNRLGGSSKSGSEADGGCVQSDRKRRKGKQFQHHNHCRAQTAERSARLEETVALGGGPESHDLYAKDASRRRVA
jgi:hypothetical protein